MGEVVVVPFGAPELGGPLSATAMLEAELADARVSLIPLHDARDRFTARSRPPQTASDSDLDVLARAAHDAIEHVAFGRTAAAQRSVREVISRAERTLESLNRETATARHILDACLSLVRSALQTGKRDLALEQATRCRRLVPDLMPSEDAHPANVVGVLAEADNLLRRMRIGNLSVRSAPESGCSVYLNGRHLGSTPFRFDRAAAGDYRVQVECNRTLARVHVVQLGDQPTSLLVDTQFDRAIASDPRLLLHYNNGRDAREQAVSHAIQLGREIGANDVILVGVQAGRAELLRVQVDQQRLVARASVPWSERHGFSRPALEDAVAVLAEARLEGQPSLAQNTAEIPSTTQHGEAEAEAPADEPPNKQAAADGPRAEPPSAKTEGTPASNQKADAKEEDSATDDDAVAPDTERVPERPRSGPERIRRQRIAGYSLLAVAAGLTAVGIGYDVRAHNLDLDLNSFYVSDVALDAAAQRELSTTQQDFDRAHKLRWIGVSGPIVATAAVALLVQPQPSVPWWGYVSAGVGVGAAVGGAIAISRSDQCVLSAELAGCRTARNGQARGATLVAAAIPFLGVPLLQWLRKAPKQRYSFNGSGLPGGLLVELNGSF